MSLSLPPPPPGPALAKKRGKKYRAALALQKKGKYSLLEALELLPHLSTTSFDATVEVHCRINADPTQADQVLRTVVDLPHGTGKIVRIAAFVPDDLVDAAKLAGAATAGNVNLIRDVEKGTIDFDIAVAVPAVMKDLGKVAKILGQRGLMPNPKSGTVTENIVRTIEALIKGRMECKMDKLGIIHTTVGKVSFGPEKLRENVETLLQALHEARPTGIKDPFILSLTLCPTMGPGMRIAL